MELILIRHAEPRTEAHAAADSADPGLSPLGRSQAEAVADWLLREPVAAIVSSPARRARETAAASARRAGRSIVTDDRLRDAHPTGGAYESLEAVKARDPIGYRRRLAAYREAPELEAVSGRVCAALDDWTARYAGERIAVFCHGSVVNLYAARVLGLAPQLFLDAVFASAHRFRVSRSALRSVQSLNETAYLESFLRPRRDLPR